MSSSDTQVLQWSMCVGALFCLLTGSVDLQELFSSELKAVDLLLLVSLAVFVPMACASVYFAANQPKVTAQTRIRNISPPSGSFGFWTCVQ